MATVDRSWLNDVYSRVNDTISRYTNGGITTVTTPTQAAIRASDVNNLFSRIDAMKNDYYLKTKPALFVSYATVNAGSKIMTATKTSLDQMITNFGTIKCKNSYSHNNGSNSNGSNSNGTHYNGPCPNNDHTKRVSGTNRHIFCQRNGTCYLGTCSNATCGNGAFNPNGAGIDISNVNAPK